MFQFKQRSLILPTNIVEMTFSLQLFLARMRKSSFVRNVLVVMSGTAIAQAIGLALSPVISRLFTPSDFGVYGSFNAVLLVLGAAVTLDYSQALLIPKSRDDSINLFVLSCLCATAITTGCIAACVLAPFLVQKLIGVSSAWMAWLLCGAILINGLNQSFQAWCVRLKAFKVTSGSQVIRSTCTNGTQVGFGYAAGGSLALIGGALLGDLFAAFYLGRVIYNDLKRDWRKSSLLRMKILAVEYLDFPMYSCSMYVMNTLSTGLPVILLTQYYGLTVAGAYAFGVRLLHAPMGLVLGALRQVNFQKVNEVHQRGGQLLPLYIKTSVALFGIAFLPATVLGIWAPDIFGWVFGEQWHVAGQYAQSLVLWMLFSFCNLPAIQYAKVIRMQRTIFIYDILLLGLRVLILVIGGQYLSAACTITTFSVTGALMNLVLIVLVGYAVKRTERSSMSHPIP